MSLIFAPLIGGIAAVVLVVFGGLMVILLGALLWRVAHTMGQGRRKYAGRLSPAAPKRTSEQHDHISSTAPNTQERLEQLKTLKEAGLIDNAEYEQRKKTILKGQ